MHQANCGQCDNHRVIPNNCTGELYLYIS